MKEKMSRFKGVISYVKETWLVHKEKFVVAWTKEFLHFGNTTTCRVESEHASLKQWLNTATGSLDTVWQKVHKQIESQATNIRYMLEQSRLRQSVTFTGRPLSQLVFKVSHYCLQLLNQELERMRGLSHEVYVRCGCVLRTSHKIPCACELKRACDLEQMISSESVHVFWRTLLINHGHTDENDGRNDLNEEQRYFKSLVDQVSKADPSVMRNISMFIHDQLHPDQAQYTEPDVKINVRGRPKVSKSTKRMPSSWEYNETRRGRARSTSSSRSRGRSGRISSSSSVHNAASSDGKTYHGSEFVHSDKIVGIIKPYVESYYDVVGDGNCGFRTVATYIFGDEEAWQTVRHHIRNEVIANRCLYQRVFVDTVDAALHRVSWDGAGCTPDYWMIVWDDLWPVATMYNSAIMLFGFSGGDTLALCGTILPLYAASTATRPSREICIAHLGNHCQHYIRLNLSPNFPVPPIVHWWFVHRGQSVVGWERFYQDRVNIDEFCVVNCDEFCVVL
ncbi:uncharacterized protein [Euphorbia lathyris]|uniref:uncharacterized protein n=1 Tax=Euphorbia lathyris TaxID=212925 RepID=UPI003313909E